jgi:hypothetical protein
LKRILFSIASNMVSVIDMRKFSLFQVCDIIQTSKIENMPPTFQDHFPPYYREFFPYKDYYSSAVLFWGINLGEIQWKVGRIFAQTLADIPATRRTSPHTLLGFKFKTSAKKKKELLPSGKLFCKLRRKVSFFWQLLFLVLRASYESLWVTLKCILKWITFKLLSLPFKILRILYIFKQHCSMCCNTYGVCKYSQHK